MNLANRHNRVAGGERANLKSIMEIVQDASGSCDS